MPWSSSDADEHKSGLSQDEKEQWAAVANDALERCLNEGGDKDECEASAIRQANGVVGNRAATNCPCGEDGCECGPNCECSTVMNRGSGEPVVIHREQLQANYQLRSATYLGRNHIIAPVVLMVEGVHNGSHGPTLYTREELSKFPAAWNGRPVPILHPQDEAGPVSCNDPNIIENQSVGHLFNVHYEDAKLRGEVWVDEERARRISPMTLAAIREGRGMEVSTGVFVEDEPVQGEFQGETYHAIARNLRPDHLALLPNEKGACSWEDGCGVRANEGKNMPRRTKYNAEMAASRPVYNSTESSDWRSPSLEDFGVSANDWSELGQEERDKVAAHFLIGNSSVSDFSQLKYPVVNPSSGSLNENALRSVINGRGAASEGVSDHTRARARLIAYQLLNEQFDAGLEIPNLEDLWARKIHDFNTNDASESYMEIVHAVQQKLDSMDSPVAIHILEDIYDGRAIVRVINEHENVEQLFEWNYSINEDGSVELQGDPKQVKREITYTPVEGNAETERASPGVHTADPARSAGHQAVVDAIRANIGYLRTYGESLAETLNNAIEKKVSSRVSEDASDSERFDAEQKIIQEMADNSGEANNYGSLSYSAVRQVLNAGIKCPPRPRLEGFAEVLDLDKSTVFEAAQKDGCEVGDIESNSEDTEMSDEDTGGTPTANASETQAQVSRDQIMQVLSSEDPESALQLFPSDLREQLRHGLNLHRQQRQHYIQTITTNSSQWSEEELKGWDINDLQRLAETIQPKANYAPLGGGAPPQANAEDEEVLLPTDAQQAS